MFLSGTHSCRTLSDFLGINPHNRDRLLRSDSRPRLSSLALGTRKSKANTFLKRNKILYFLLKAMKEKKPTQTQIES